MERMRLHCLFLSRGKPFSKLALYHLTGFFSGSYFGYSAYINSYFLGSGEGVATLATRNGGIDLLNGTWALNSSVLNAEDNVVSVILDNTGSSQPIYIDVTLSC